MTTIGPSLLITGDITSQEDVTIHGRVNGHIRMREASLVVAPKAHVEGDVHGVRITIHGALVGNVTSTSRIELTPTADVRGTLSGPSIVVQEGALFNGRIEMNAAATVAQVAKVAKAS
jgi:cytoskeletal protein CcmA (bactofilin family)